MASSGKLLNPDRLKPKTIAMYALGTVGRDMVYNLFTVSLMTYILFTKSLDVPQFAAISVIFMVCRIFDAVIDPLIGGLIENARSRFGKYKPWIISGMIICAFSVVAVFSLPIKGWEFVGFLAVAYALFSASYSLNDIAYWGMLPALASNPKDRSKLASLTGIAAGVGSFVMSTFLPMFTAGKDTIGGNAQTAYSYASLFAVCSMIGFMCFTIFGIKDPQSAEDRAKQPKQSLRKTFSIIFHNDQLLWTALIFFIQNIGSSVTGGGLSMLYIYFTYGYNGFLLTVSGLLGSGLSLVTMLLFPTIFGKFGIKVTVKASIIIMSAAHVIIFLAGTLLPKDPWEISYAGVIFGLAVIGISNALFFYSMIVAIANTVEYNEYKTGERDESLIFAVRPFLLQLAGSLNQLITTVIYLALGITYITTKISDFENAEALKQISEAAKLEGIDQMLQGVNPNTTFMVLVLMCTLPIIIINIAYQIFRKKFALDEKEFERISAEIKAKKLQANSVLA